MTAGADCYIVPTVERQIYARITDEEYATLEAHANEHERSLAAELRLAVRAWLAKIESNNNEKATV